MAGSGVDLQEAIEGAFDDRELLKEPFYRDAVLEAVRQLDAGEVRLAEKVGGEWVTYPWVQKAIRLYFLVTELATMRSGPLEYYDRLPLKVDYGGRGIRAVPGAVARYGSHIEPGVILMPSFVNIGAYVATGTVVDTWATVGSGAQIGQDVHLAGGVGIGGVLEPPGARPVVIEDGAFVGSRSVVVEGVVIEARAIIAAQVTLTASTHIIDVTGPEPVTHKGRVPANAVVIPGARPREFAAGPFHVSAALIVGYRAARHEGQLTLMQEARAFGAEL